MGVHWRASSLRLEVFKLPAPKPFHSPTSSDWEILIALKKIAEELGESAENCSVTVNVMEGYQSNPTFLLSEIQGERFAQHAKEHDGATWEGVSIHFRQRQLDVNLHRDRERGADKIKISFGKDPFDAFEVRWALSAIQQQFIPLNRAEAIEQALGPEIAEFYRRREETLSRLEKLTGKLVRETHDYRMRLDAETAEHKRELTASLEEEYKKKTAALEIREQDLERIRQALDDRSARHARREQSRALQKKISDRSKKFNLTPATRNKRWPVHVIFGGLLSLSGGLIGFSLLSTPTATEGAPLWLELAHLPLGVLGFALTAVFYIRWNDQWFRQHAEQEFRLQQLALDVDRAGYATEMLLEWQEDKGGEMPAMMVDRLTAGLFTDQTKVERVRHPSEDAIAALLKAASSVRVDVPGIGELSLTGRQIRKVDRSLAKKRVSKH